jgi:excisionase family DNA binding protein
MKPHKWLAVGKVRESSGLNTQWQCANCGARRTEEPGREPPPFGDSGCTQGKEESAVEPFVTAAEVGKFLGGMSEKAVYQAVHRGELPAYRLGKRRLRFRLSELEQAVKQVKL